MKYAICILAHHKPWLMMGSLITLSLQGKQEYDLHIIYIQGTGECEHKDTYSDYHDIVRRTGQGNPQLSQDQESVLDIVRQTGFQVTYHYYENDHGLDSGTWIKFFRDGKWRVYDYVFCFMEGFLFTGVGVLSAVKEFINRMNPDVIDVGHEQRALPNSVMKNYVTRGDNISEIDYFHQKKINEIYDLFRRDKNFEELYQLWRVDPLLRESTHGVTRHFVPDRVYTLRTKIREYARYFVKKRRLFFPFRDQVFYAHGHDRHLVPFDYLVDGAIKIRGVKFFREDSPFFFGCSCQHIFSRKFLESLEKRWESNNLYEVLNIPFCGTPLELIWGMMPAWLGYEKWVFDGAHRPRKNFITLRREDDQEGLAHNINRYFKGVIRVVPSSSAGLTIVRVADQHKSKIEILGSSYMA
jgi:hypothetical protein